MTFFPIISSASEMPPADRDYAQPPDRTTEQLSTVGAFVLAVRDDPVLREHLRAAPPTRRTTPGQQQLARWTTTFTPTPPRRDFDQVPSFPPPGLRCRGSAGGSLPRERRHGRGSRYAAATSRSGNDEDWYGHDPVRRRTRRCSSPRSSRRTSPTIARAHGPVRIAPPEITIPAILTAILVVGGVDDPVQRTASPARARIGRPSGYVWRAARRVLPRPAGVRLFAAATRRRGRHLPGRCST